MKQANRIFLYAEFQASIPFNAFDWQQTNQTMLSIPGLKSKTWLSGINTLSVGGFYEFDSVNNARAYAEGVLASFAKAANASLSVKLFDGDIVAEASKEMNSPYFPA